MISRHLVNLLTSTYRVLHSVCSLHCYSIIKLSPLISTVWWHGAEGQVSGIFFSAASLITKNKFEKKETSFSLFILTISETRVFVCRTIRYFLSSSLFVFSKFEDSDAPRIQVHDAWTNSKGTSYTTKQIIKVKLFHPQGTTPANPNKCFRVRRTEGISAALPYK